MSSSSRNKILSKIKASMEEGRDYTFPLSGCDTLEFPMPANLLETFKLELEAIGGFVSVVKSKDNLKSEVLELVQKQKLSNIFCLDTEIESLLADKNINLNNKADDFVSMEAAITQCEYLISRTGTVVVSSAHQSGRRLNVFPPVHIVLAKKSQLLAFPTDALSALVERYGNNFPSLVSFITGASRTADIEKTLVMGAHGPKELYVFIDESR